MGPCFLAFVVIVVFLIVIASQAKSTANAPFNFALPSDPVAPNETAALGIILKIDNNGIVNKGPSVYLKGPNASGKTYLRPTVELRNAVVDVEIPGQAPYQVAGKLTIPGNMVADVLPGSSVELRVTANKSSLRVVGPGSGFAGFGQAPIAFHQDGST
jgi:hypothetical protein